MGLIMLAAMPFARKSPQRTIESKLIWKILSHDKNINFLKFFISMMKFTFSQALNERDGM